MSWDSELTKNTLAWMKLLGDFSPTSSPAQKQVKGYMLDNDGEGYKVYFDAGELRELAIACLEVSDWLMVRASKEE